MKSLIALIPLFLSVGFCLPELPNGRRDRDGIWGRRKDEGRRMLKGLGKRVSALEGGLSLSEKVDQLGGKLNIGSKLGKRKEVERLLEEIRDIFTDDERVNLQEIFESLLEELGYVDGEFDCHGIECFKNLRGGIDVFDNLDCQGTGCFENLRGRIGELNNLDCKGIDCIKKLRGGIDGIDIGPFGEGEDARELAPSLGDGVPFKTPLGDKNGVNLPVLKLRRENVPIGDIVFDYIGKNGVSEQALTALNYLEPEDFVRNPSEVFTRRYEELRQLLQWLWEFIQTLPTSTTTTTATPAIPI